MKFENLSLVICQIQTFSKFESHANIRFLLVSSHQTDVVAVKVWVIAVRVWVIAVRVWFSYMTNNH